MELYKKLGQYSRAGVYPFHMPGHKRNGRLMPDVAAEQLDITEIEGFDNLHGPEGILKEAMEFAAKVCHSENTYFLVNGSTVGNLAGILACTKKGDTVLAARNCHKSVYNGIFLNELTVHYLYPDSVRDSKGLCSFQGEILPEDVEEALLKYPEAKMVIITSPTYEGIVSDIGRIAKIVHSHGKILMVDEAHGAHFGLGRGFPRSAVSMGADIVVQSPHKTLPAYTQSGVLHLNGSRVDKLTLEMYLSALQSSSPSYILMAGLDHCYHLIYEKGEELFLEYNKNLDGFYGKCKRELKHFSLFYREKLFDKSKLVICYRGASANLGEVLRRRYGIEVEMCAIDYVIAMTSVCDRPEGFERLYNALLELDGEEKAAAKGQFREDVSGMDGTDRKLHREKLGKESSISAEGKKADRAVMSIYEAVFSKKERVELKSISGRIAADYIYAYPPGIPLVVPGEIFDEAILDMIENYENRGISVRGIKEGKALCVC